MEMELEKYMIDYTVLENAQRLKQWIYLGRNVWSAGNENTAGMLGSFDRGKDFSSSQKRKIYLN